MRIGSRVQRCIRHGYGVEELDGPLGTVIDIASDEKTQSITELTVRWDTGALEDFNSTEKGPNWWELKDVTPKSEIPGNAG